MKKSIVLIMGLCLFAVLGCTTDEENIVEKDIVKSTLKIASSVPVPEIIKDQVVIQFKADNLNEEEKNQIRDRCKNKYNFDIKKIETCDCDNDGIELWTIDTTFPDFIGVEDLVRNLKDSSSTDDMDGDLQFSIKILNNDMRKGEHFYTIAQKTVARNQNEAVNIAILDTGIDYDYLSEPVLYNSRDTNGCKDEISGWDFVNSDNDPRDDNGHGSFVSKVVTDVLDRTNVRYHLLPVKAFDENGNGLYSNVVCAMKYISKKPGNFIVNTSFGFYGVSNQVILKNIISSVEDRMLFVSSSGNEGLNTDISGNEHFPSSYDSPNMLTVGGYTGSLFAYPSIGTTYVTGLNRAVDSNYGSSSIDVVAPFDGYHLVLTSPGSIITADVQGTSFSCGYATSRAARLFNRTTGLPSEIKSKVLYSAYKSYAFNGLINNGRVLVKGMINDAVNGPTVGH